MRENVGRILIKNIFSVEIIFDITLFYNDNNTPRTIVKKSEYII
jgi:hypothetical protein